MTETDDQLRTLILEGRVTPPEFNEAFVPRMRLIAELRSAASRLVTVTAPAGYGKTSLLAEWQRAEDRVTAWLSFRAEDNDPAAVIRLLAHACAGFLPQAEALLGQISNVDGGVLGRSAPALALLISRAEQPFVLFLDDAHTVDDPECTDVLSIVLGAVPKGSQVVLASRAKPTRFARGRVSAASAHVDAEDLRIDATGAARIAEEAGARVDPKTLDEWVERSGGWAAGLHMYALLSKRRPAASITTDALLADYLYQECVGELPEETRQFLLRSSILQMHIPELCDAVLQRTDSAAILRDLENRQLFVAADPGGQSYRIHPLFREYLNGELKLQSGSVVAELHRRAAQWFLQLGQLPEAINHTIAAGDLSAAASLVIPAGIRAYEEGQDRTLGRWLDEIGEANLLANPSAVIVIAWFSLLASTDEAAEKWSTLLERLPDDAQAEGMNVASAKAMIRAVMMTDGMAKALADAEFAAEVEPVESPWRDPALQILGSTLLHAGHEDRAVKVLREASHTADARGNPATVVICQTEFALLSIEQERWVEAEAQLGKALDAIAAGRIEGYVMCAYTHAAAAYVALRFGRRAEGERYLSTAMSERQRCGRSVPLLGIPTRLLLMRAQLSLGDAVAAATLLGEIEGMLPPAGDRGALDRRIDAARSALRHHERHSEQTMQSVVLTAAEQRVLPYLQTHLNRAEIAERLHVSRNTVGTHISRIFHKFGTTSRAEAVKRAFELGMLGAAPEAEPRDEVEPPGEVEAVSGR